MMTPAEFVEIVENDGGLVDAICDYGLSHRDLDESDPDFNATIQYIHGSLVALQPHLRRYDVMVEEMELGQR